MEENNLAKLSHQEIALGLTARVLQESNKIKCYITGKIAALQAYLSESSSYAKKFAELSEIIAGAEKYIEMLRSLVEALEKDELDLAQCVEQLIESMQNGTATPADADQGLNNIICKVTSLKYVCRTAQKNINISYSRYEHAFEKHKMFYKCFSNILNS